MSEFTDEELLAELGVSIETVNRGKYSALEERIIASFEDIQRFIEEHGHLPRHGEENDIFERLHAIRLDRIRELPEAKDLLSSIDKFGLLDADLENGSVGSDIEDEALLAELGVELTDESNVTVLKHVPTREEKRAADEIANRTKCEDFEKFEPLFAQAESELASGVRKSRRFSGDINISKGEFFILGGQMAYVAEKGNPFRAPNGETDARLRVIYSNGTESNLLQRSLQRALYKDEAGRRLTDPGAFDFGDEWEDGDVESGTIYVLRSHSDHPFIAENREVVHKIGVTSGKIETRLANAKLDATFLLADVEVIATYKLSGINRGKLEKILHRVFQAAQIDLSIEDRFGNPVRPREWFLVPLPVIDQAIGHIRDGSITDLVYDPSQAQLVPRSSACDSAKS